MLSNLVKHVCCLIVGSACSAYYMWDVWSLKCLRPFLSVSRRQWKERPSQLKHAPPCPPAAPGDLQRRRLAGCVQSRELELSAGGWGVGSRRRRRTSPLWAAAARGLHIPESRVRATAASGCARAAGREKQSRLSRAAYNDKRRYVKTELIWVTMADPVLSLVFFPATATADTTQACAFVLTSS